MNRSLYLLIAFTISICCTAVYSADRDAMKKKNAVAPAAPAAAAAVAKLAGDWSGKWVDVWKYNGQGGDLSCTATAGEGNELVAVFKAPGFMKEPVTVKLKIKEDGSANGTVDMGKPAGTLTFHVKLTADKFTGDYDSLEERGKFEMTKK